MGNWGRSTKAIAVSCAAACFLLPAVAQLQVNHAECQLFGPDREKFTSTGLSKVPRNRNAASALTEAVMAGMPEERFAANVPKPMASVATALQLADMGTIDRYLFGAMQSANVAPAAPTNDFEFIRRVTLDLTGRIPPPDRVLAFTSDTSPGKRAKLIDSLLSSPEWVDKWTMYFGDMLKNTQSLAAVRRYPDGRNAFYNWIKNSLSANKPFDQMAREIIAAKGDNSYDPAQGQINWIVGGIVTGGPAQDIWDQQTANVAETFLGLGHMNCLLCHNGRGHLDSLSLWGKNSSRMMAWGLAAYFSHTTTARTPVDPTVKNSAYYWSVSENMAPNAPDYRLNTTTGNRPARQPIGSISAVSPVYPFSGNKPKPGESYRTAMAREVTADFQFARAAVNYIWKEFFVTGLVEPANQFDPARLDPNNPPPDPWKLQPSNAALLNALAQDFIDSRYDIQALMRQIANSQAYQLSTRYNGDWNPAWEKLYARKLVRRLWAEEIHDAIAQSSNLLPNYKITDTWFVHSAMQLPEPRGMPGGAASVFLDSFLRGNREDAERRSEGSPSQALSLMNDAYVMSRIKASTSGGVTSLLAQYLNQPDRTLVQSLYLTVLSRYPGDDEMQAALASLQGGVRQQKAENLLWSLYNKVDFIFNY